MGKLLKGFIDNSVQLRMIKNRPPLSVVPPVNMSVHASTLGRRALLGAFIVGMGLIFTSKLGTEILSK